jgi:hypothetical protein
VTPQKTGTAGQDDSHAPSPSFSANPTGADGAVSDLRQSRGLEFSHFVRQRIFTRSNLARLRKQIMCLCACTPGLL